MTTSNLYLTATLRASPNIGRLVSMMNYARHTTLEAVKGLTSSNSIIWRTNRATLLAHCCSTSGRLRSGTITTPGRAPDADEMREWGSGFQLGGGVHREAQGHELEYYVDASVYSEDAR
jgi:hypothetical protein